MLRTVCRRASLILALIAFGTVSTLAQERDQSQTVYVTKTGAKYHRATCSSLRYSKIAISLSDAARRYQPCKVCKPPTLVAAPAAETIPAPSSTTAARKSADSGRCQAITKKGTQCTRRAKPGSSFCWQHGG